MQTYFEYKKLSCLGKKKHIWQEKPCLARKLTIDFKKKNSLKIRVKKPYYPKDIIPGIHVVNFHPFIHSNQLKALLKIHFDHAANRRHSGASFCTIFILKVV